MGKKIAGTCFVKVNGQQLELQGNVEFPLTSVQRETLLSTTGVAGYKETVVAPYVSGDFIVPAGFPIEDIKENTAQTITVECANGMVYTLSDAYAVDTIAYKPIDGTLTIKWEGMNGELG
jgi:hypothetical protein